MNASSLYDSGLLIEDGSSVKGPSKDILVAPWSLEERSDESIVADRPSDTLRERVLKVWFPGV